MACLLMARSGDKLVGLGTYLDEDGDLADFPLVDSLAEAILVERRRQSPSERLLVARWAREQVDAWLEGRRSESGLSYLPRTPEFFTALLWQAECLENPQLAARFEEHLPLPVRVKYRHGAAPLRSCASM